MKQTHVNPALSRSMTGSFFRTALFLQRQLWIWPLIAAAVLAVIAIWVRERVENAIQAQLASELEIVLKADVEGLKIWLESQRSNASAAARSDDVERLVGDLIAVADKPGAGPLELAASQATRDLVEELLPWREEHDYTGYIVADTKERIIASHAPELLGKRSLPGYSDFLPKVLAGEATVSHPFPSLIVLEDRDGRASAGVPTMYAAAPVRNAAGQIIAALGFRLDPEQDFTRILSIARGGTSGETYAFNRQGLMLSESRFDEDLKRIGLIANRPESRSILQLDLRDPGGDMLAGFRPMCLRDELPFTEPVREAVAGRDGVNTVGYRDYRGVVNVAAWKWLPEYDFGVLTEIDRAEAYAPLYVVRPVFWGLFGLLAASALAIFVFTLFVSRLKQAEQHAALKALQLGQYKLEEKIGEGAMGVVYRGHHAMLRRPTAIKLLNIEKMTDVSVARFEREVRLTSQLNHPNTISIYDFGRTPEGIFYYAMELIDGINLDALVRGFGPLPEGRVIFFLSQLCGSLNEAHLLGLIHRDIKPANVMVCQRGGQCDVVKLLDFGLVKAIDAEREGGLTASNALTGTPLYLSPEAFVATDSVDARSDLYSLGALAYYLLTGTTVFTGRNLIEICRQHVDAPPIPPSTRLGRQIDPELESLILRCLAKQPADRPASAAELANALEHCSSAGTWTEADARAWWSKCTATAPLAATGPATVSGQFAATVLGTTQAPHDL